MPQAIGVLIGAVLVISIIVAVVVFVYTLLIFVSANVIVIADKLLGSWAIVHPIISWAIMGFLLGSILYFAVIESPKLNRPNIKPALIFLACVLVLLTPALGPATDRLHLKSRGIQEKIQAAFSDRKYTKAPSSEKNNIVSRNQSHFNKQGAFGKYVCKAPKGINLRSGPSTRYRIIGVVKYGDEVTILGKEPSQTDSRYFYYKVSIEAGKIGFAWAGKNEEWFVPAT